MLATRDVLLVLDVFAFVLALVVCLVSIRLFHGICSHYGHVDAPGGHKRHAEPTPLCGGFAIGLTFVAVGAAMGLSGQYAGLALGLVVLAGVGARDDARPVPAVVRLGAQTVAVLLGMVLIGGVELSSLGQLFGDAPVTLGWLAAPFTLFAVVGLLNAINMIDGVDGLAGGYSLLVFVVLGGAGLAAGLDVTLICVLIGAVMAFLVCNMRAPWRRRAGIFLGDAGSLILGFALAWFAVAFSQGGSPALRPITMIWLFGLPLADTGYLMASRAITNGSPMRADRRHFHHLLQRWGLSPGQTCIAWLGAAALFMLVGLAGEWADVSGAAMFVGFWAVFGLYAVLNVYAWSRLVAGMRRGEVSP